MPLSISSSDQQLVESRDHDFFPPAGDPAEMRRVRLATVTLIAMLALLMVIVELGARYLYPKFSRIERRITLDKKEVKSLVDQSQKTPPTVLLIGNSLLLHALDYPKIQNDLTPTARPVRYVIENTEYLDWYYGLRRLFAEGVRPSMVVLCLNLGQTLSHGVLDQSAWHLFGARDLLAISRDAGMDTTQTSGLVFAHWSAFYAGRGGIRNYILNVTDPSYAAELHRLARHPPVLPSEEKMLAQSRERLRALDQLCRQNGTKFVLLIPPAFGSRNDLLLRAGTLEHVDVDAPITSGSLGPEFFRDDRFHLNEKGATVFTDAIVRDLRARLNSQ